MKLGYDKSSVGILSGLARTMLKLGMLNKISQSEVGRLLTLMNAANGKADLTNDVDDLFDLMTRNLLRVSTARLGSFTPFQHDAKPLWQPIISLRKAVWWVARGRGQRCTRPWATSSAAVGNVVRSHVQRTTSFTAT